MAGDRKLAGMTNWINPRVCSSRARRCKALAGPAQLIRHCVRQHKTASPMVALKKAEQNEGVLAFTNQLIDDRVRCHHSPSASNEIPSLLFVAPSRLGTWR